MSSAAQSILKSQGDLAVAGGPARVRYAIPHALAQLDANRHHVVEASAGTGKTYLIEHRVVDLLLTTETVIEQILVVTFTERATAELRFRIRRLLETVSSANEDSAEPDEPHWLIDDAARRKLRDALMSFDRAAIYTIHAFCQRVLTENAFANRRLFAQTQIATEEAFAEAFKSALREVFAREQPDRSYLAAWMRSGRDVDALESLLYRCASQRGRLVPDHDPEVTARALDQAAQELPRPDDTDALTKALKSAKVHASSIRAVIRRLEHLRELLDQWTEHRDVSLFLTEIEARDKALRPKRLLPYLAEKLGNAKIDALREPAVRGDLMTMRDVAIALERAVVPLAAAVAQRFLPVVIDRMDEEKKRRGHFDFHDMLRLVWESLEGESSDEVMARLRKRYRYALIDEFQDTDELQWKIFRRLYLDAPDEWLEADGDAGSGAVSDSDAASDSDSDSDADADADADHDADSRLALTPISIASRAPEPEPAPVPIRNRLCIIGDPKQAIYSFRGADVYTYLEARAQVQEVGGQVTNLIDNYRSTDGLVRAYNTLFEEHFGTGFFTGDIRYDHPVRAATDLEAQDANGQPIVPICLLRVQPPGDGKLRAELLRNALLRTITSEIRRLLYEPDATIRVGVPVPSTEEPAGDTTDDSQPDPPTGHPEESHEPDGERADDGLSPIQAGDIFVLTRTINESNDVAARLRLAGIPCAIYKQEGLFQSQEAREVRDLLAGVAEPRSRSARFQAWVTRFFGVTLSDLPHLGELPETHPLVARLFEWKTLADKLAYEELFARIVDDSGIIERELFLDTSERSLTNFLHLFELLLEEVMRSRCELHELIQRLNRWIADTADLAADERNVQRLESEKSAVQIMTIHRSKGLEANVVFVYGGFGGFPGDEVQVYHDHGERLVHIGYAGSTVERAVGHESASEDQRLLYVALTRAAARLYLPYVDKSAYNKLRGSYAQLIPRLEIAVRALQSGDQALTRLFELRDVATHVDDDDWSDRSTAIAAWQPPGALLSPGARESVLSQEAREARAGFAVTSYTRMKSHGATRVPLAAVDFKADIAQTSARLADDQLPGGAQSGVFLHNVLEYIDFASVLESAAPGIPTDASGPGDDGSRASFDEWRQRPDIERLFRHTMLRHNRDPQHLLYSQQVIHRCLTTPITLGRQILPSLASCRRIMREVEFLYPIPTNPALRAALGLHGRADSGQLPEPAGQALDPIDDRLIGDSIRMERGYIKGFIDLIFEFRGRVYAVDWKSDILPDYGSKTMARHVFYEYQVQAELYALAVSRLLELKTAYQHKKRFGGLLYLFIRGLGSSAAGSGQAGVYYIRPSFARLAELESALEKRDDYQ